MLARRTQELYRGYLDQIRLRLGQLAIAAIRSSQGEHAGGAAPLALGHARRMDYIQANSAANPGRPPMPRRDGNPGNAIPCSADETLEN